MNPVEDGAVISFCFASWIVKRFMVAVFAVFKFNARVGGDDKLNFDGQIVEKSIYSGFFNAGIDTFFRSGHIVKVWSTISSQIGNSKHSTFFQFSNVHSVSILVTFTNFREMFLSDFRTNSLSS